MEDKKLNKTFELILLIIMIVSLSGQNLLINPIQRKSTSKGANTESTQAVHKNVITRKNILDTNQLKTQQLMSPSATTTNAFISTWNTSKISSGSTNSTQIELPLENIGVYNFIVDWGDGTPNSTITSYTQGIAPHNYSNAGVYTITITGVISGWRLGVDVSKIIGISQWGPLNLGTGILGTFGWYFSGATNLDVTATDPLNLTGTTSLADAFYDCYNLGSSGKGNFNSWDTSGVTDMSSLFGNDYAFNLSISNWNVASVTTMAYMFANDYVFNQDISSWNVASVTDMSGLFNANHAFNQPIGTWDVSSVSKMPFMFAYNYVFNQDISSWNVAGVTDMSNMFNSAYAFNQSIGSWDVSSVTSMANMFHGASVFDQPIGNWIVSRVTDMSNMFDGASAFNQPLGSWDVSNVTTMSFMFAYNLIFNQPLGTWNVSSVTNMNDMLFGDTLSIQNYDELLIGWSALSLQQGVLFNAGSSYYSATAASARQYIVKTFGWTISDRGETIEVPSAPLSVKVSPGTGDYDSLLVTWSVPATNGGSTIISYSIYSSTTNDTGFSLITTVAGTANSYNNTGLSDVTYFFIVSAINSIGAGPNSTVVSGIPNTPPTSSSIISSSSPTSTPNPPTKTGHTPGFEAEILLLAIGFLFLLRKRRIKHD